MVYIISILLALVTIELAIIIVLAIRRIYAGVRASDAAVLPPSAASTIAKNGHDLEGQTGAAGHADVMAKEEREAGRRQIDEYEKRWREGMDGLMGYDMSIAKRAVRNSGDE